LARIKKSGESSASTDARAGDLSSKSSTNLIDLNDSREYSDATKVIMGTQKQNRVNVRRKLDRHPNCSCRRLAPIFSHRISRWNCSDKRAMLENGL
jgi:hypothetical protein